MCLTFAEIKEKCKPGDILICSGEFEREFVGITSDNKLVTYYRVGCATSDWREGEVEWTIKPKMKKIKIERWLNIYSNGAVCSHDREIDALEAKGVNALETFHFCKEYEVEDK